MKTRSDIEDRIRYLLAEALEARVKEASERLPHRCRHNHQHPLDTRRQVHGESNEVYNRITVRAGDATTQTIGLCMLGSEHPDEWPGDICEDPIDAQRCPYFDPLLNKETVWREFSNTLRDPDALRGQFPEIYGLIWSLEPSEGWLTPGMVPWWKRLWFRLHRLRVEPIRLTDDNYVRLLQAPGEGTGKNDSSPDA